MLTSTKPDKAIYSYDYDVMNRLTHEYYKESATDIGVTLADYSYSILSDGNTQKTEKKYLNSTDTAFTTSIYDYANRLIEQDNPDGTKVFISYNKNGTKATSTDANKNVTYYSYDSQNRPTEQWTPFENNGSILYSYSKIGYDKGGRKTSEILGKDKVALYAVPTKLITSSFTYYIDNKLESQTDSSGKKISYVYDADGNVIKTTEYVDSATQNVTEYLNNYFGKPDVKGVHVRKDDISGNDFTDNTDTVILTNYSYDKNGNVKTMTTPDTIITTYEYDNLDRQLSVSQPGINEIGTATTIKNSNTLRHDGKVLTTTDAKGKVTTFVYDGRGELIRKVDAKQNTSASYYDLGGRKIADVAPKDYTGLELPTMNRTEYGYDLMGRVKTIKSIYLDTITNTTKNITTKSYDYYDNGNVKNEFDGLNNKTITTYNLANKPVTIQDPATREKGLAFTVSYDYDGAGRKVSETNAKGNITSYTYDDANNILKITVKKTATDAEKIIKSASYDLMGNVKYLMDGNGKITGYTYNALNKVKGEVRPGDASIASNTINYQYDVMGNLKGRRDYLGKLNTYTYDNQGRVLTSTEQALDGSNPIKTSVNYDVNGNKRYLTDGNLVKTENIYDDLNRIISTSVTVNKVAEITNFRYDANSNKTGVMDWRGNITEYVYDPLNRLIQTKDANGKYIETLEYNDNGTQSKSTDALNNVTQYFYDKNKRLVNTIDPELHTTSQTYDEVGNINSKTDGDNNVTNYSYDEFNNLLTVKNAKLETTSYTYDLNGNMLSQTDGNIIPSTSIFEYNVANKIIRRIDNGGRTGTAPNYVYNATKIESYNYRVDGNISAKTDRNGVYTAYTYDIHGRMLTETVGLAGVAGTIVTTYTYDNNGNQRTVTDATGTTTRTYDELNRTTSKTVPVIGTSNYIYDVTTGMTTETYGEITTDPKGNSTYKIYDKVGRLWKVTADTKTNTYVYYDNGSLNSITYANGSSENYTYYKDNLLNTLINKKSDGSIIDSYSYNYDGSHSISSKVDARGTTNYIYDKLNRIYTVTEPDTTKTTYDYDGSGNRATETVVKLGITAITVYNYNNQNKLTTSTTKTNGIVTQTIAYSYDNNGSQLTSVTTPYVNGVAGARQTTTNIYDKLNQLVKTTTPDGKIIINIYDGEGIRIAKTSNGVTRRYLYQGDKVVLELDVNGAVIGKNVYGTNLLSRTVGTTKAYYMYNGHADVTSLLGEDGKTALNTYYYDEFGVLKNSTGTFDNPYTYSGYQYDSETGTYYLMARMYDPTTGRFLQEDSYRGNKNDPLSLNYYTYCNGNPLIYWDPTGHITTYEQNVSKYQSAATKGTFQENISNYENAAENAQRVIPQNTFQSNIAKNRSAAATGTVNQMVANYTNSVTDSLKNMVSDKRAIEVTSYHEIYDNDIKQILIGLNVYDFRNIYEAYGPRDLPTIVYKKLEEKGYTNIDELSLSLYIKGLQLETMNYSMRELLRDGAVQSVQGAGSSVIMINSVKLVSPSGSTGIGTTENDANYNWNSVRTKMAGKTEPLVNEGFKGVSKANNELSGLYGFKTGITADEIKTINKGFGGTTELSGNIGTVLDSSSRYDGFWNKTAAITRSIVKNHTFDNGNKRTAQAVIEELMNRNNISTGVNQSTMRDVINKIATGQLKEIADIAKSLRGF